MAGWAELGVVPQAAVGAVRERAHVDVPRILEIEDRTHHDVLAFTESIAEQVNDPEHARWFHYGLTSSDIGRHGARPADARRRRAHHRGDHRRRARRARPRRGVPRHPDDRPHPRRARRAHHLRPEAARLGDRAAPPARAPADRLRRRRRRQALRRSGRLRQHRSARGGVRPRGAGPAPRGRGHPGDPARPPRRPACRDRRRRREPRALSRSRSATCSAPRCARRASRSPRARRARRPCRTSRTRSCASGSAGSPGCCVQTPSSASRTSPCGTSATSPTPPPSGWCCPTPPSALDYMLEKTRWLIEGLVAFPDRMLKNLEDSPRPGLLGPGAAAAGRVRPLPRGRLRDRAAKRPRGLGQRHRSSATCSRPTPMRWRPSAPTRWTPHSTWTRS